MNDKEHRNLERAGKADTDRILTIPNVLSFFRLALIPVIIVLYAKNEVWWAFGMLVLSGVTDVVDGWVARTYHMVSNFGKAIDPVADKLTQIAVLLCLMPMKCWWVVGILVLKEVSIGIMTLLTLHHTGMVYGAGWYGKLCTAVIYLSMFVLMLWRTAPDWFLYADAALCACPSGRVSGSDSVCSAARQPPKNRQAAQRPRQTQCFAADSARKQA